MNTDAEDTTPEVFKSEYFQGLLGQMAADALVQDALLISLMELAPDIHHRIEARARATALGSRLNLRGEMQRSFDSRLQERWKFFHDGLSP